MLPAELAGHLAAAIPLGFWNRPCGGRAGRRRPTLAGLRLRGAAGHLARVREAVADTGAGWPEADLVELLTAEADLRLRSGDADAGATPARHRVDPRPSRRTSRPPGSVALGQDRLGARFAMPRAELAAVLEAAATALDGRGTADEALVLAALARQWQHSVPASDGGRVRLAERSVAIARSIDDPATLARRRSPNTTRGGRPGPASARAAIAAEIAAARPAAGRP